MSIVPDKMVIGAAVIAKYLKKMQGTFKHESTGVFHLVLSAYDFNLVHLYIFQPYVCT
jgi:hypothetical protein